jgi:hypothetical protein
MLQRALAQSAEGSSIAAMAVDTAALYTQCFADLHTTARAVQLPWADFAGGSSGASGSHIAQFEGLLHADLPWGWPEPVLHVLALAVYVQWQVGHTYSLAALCAAEASLSANDAGEAVALARLGAGLAERLGQAGARLSSVLDMHAGTGDHDSRRRLLLQAMLEHKAGTVLKKCVTAGGAYQPTRATAVHANVGMLTTLRLPHVARAHTCTCTKHTPPA